MTREKLESVYYLKKELRMWKRRLAEIQADIAQSPAAPDGMPYSRTNKTTDPTQKKAIQLSEADAHIKKQIKKIEKAEAEVERYIITIKDPILKLIVEYRCIYNMNWQEIGEDVGYTERHCRRKYKSFVKRLR